MFYGWRAKDLGDVTVPGACPSCGTPGSVELHVLQRYAHALWIPLFPLGKKGIARCSHCGQKLEGRAMGENARMVLSGVKGHFKTPAWTYTGLIIIALLIPAAFWQSGKNDALINSMLNTPQVGDLYEVKLGPRRYSLYRVDRISGDSIYVAAYNLEVEKWRQVNGLIGKEGGHFGTRLTGYSRGDMLAMRSDGTILSVRKR